MTLAAAVGSSADVLLYAAVALALVFGFTNGVHDTANAVASSISTRALSPRVAVTIAALMNLAGAFSSTAVATTVGTAIVRTEGLEQEVILAALVGATAWNVLTWWLALPSSSSYALVGGLIGGALVVHGVDGMRWAEIARRLLVPAAVAPLAGFALAYLLMLAVVAAFRARRPEPVNRGFRVGQVGAGALVAFAHGANDAQKTMGVIGLALLAAGRTQRFSIPTWVVVASAAALALGTYVGGGRIMRTLGFRVYRLEPPHGFAAQVGATSILLGAAVGGAPVSTTHVVTGSVIGAGASTRIGSVPWAVAGHVLVTWALTVPAAAALAALLLLPMRLA